MKSADTFSILESGTLEVQGLLPWSSNYTFLMRACKEGKEVEAVYKPQQGERPLWDFAQGTLCLRERAAYLVSAALGWDIVPHTILRDGPHGFGSLQLFINHDPEKHYFTFEGSATHRQQLQQIALFDILINNADRKSGHVLLEQLDDLATPGRLWAIDHGVSFHTDYKLRTVIWEFTGLPLPKDLIADLKLFQERLCSRTHSLYTELKALLTSFELTVLQRRVEKLIKDPVFPEPGPGRHYPWPPV